MKTSMLLFVCLMTLFLAIVPTQAEAQKEIGKEWLVTAPVLWDGAQLPLMVGAETICAAVNVGGSAITIELAFFNAAGLQQSGTTYAGLTCGELAPGRVCAIQEVYGVRPLYCRITVPAGRRDFVRGSIGAGRVIGEAR